MPTLRSNVVVQSGGGGGNAATVSAWVNMYADVNMVQSVAFNSLLVFPLCAGNFPGVMTANTFGLVLSANATASSSHSSTVQVGIYTLAASNQLSLLNSVSSSWSRPASAQNYQGYYWGARQLSFHSSQWSAAPAFDQSHYWVGVIFQSSHYQNTPQIRGAAIFNQTWMGAFGAMGSSTCRPYPGLGALTVSTGGLPSAVSMSDLSFNTAFADGIPLVVMNNLAT